MKKPWLITVFAAVLPAMFGQPKPDQPVKPVMVCEVLGDLLKYRGKNLAILGRLDCGDSLIDRNCFLAEDQCERPVITEGYVWPSRVFVGEHWEEGMPKPPSGTPQIDEPTLIEKLSLLRKTTKLGFHEVPMFKTKGRTITFWKFGNVKDEWGVAYGNVFSASKLERDSACEEMGCRGILGVPAALIIGSDGLRSFKDEAYPSSVPQK
jgi:hypothetical protein